MWRGTLQLQNRLRRWKQRETKALELKNKKKDGGLEFDLHGGMECLVCSNKNFAKVSI